jgi:hypothetical protein
VSDTYEKFAKDTYATIYGAMSQHMRNNPGKPMLVSSGESHYDTTSEKIFGTSDPALAAAYSHMAAMLAAEKLVGKRFMVVTFEQPPGVIDDISRNLQLGKKLPEVLRNQPMARAIEFAVSRGYTVTGTDEGQTRAINRATQKEIDTGNPDYNKILGRAADDNSRYVEERTALNNVMDTRPRPKIVVNVGGAAHIQTLSGFAPTTNVGQMSESRRSGVVNPFENTYGHPVFINSSDKTNTDNDITFKFINSAQNAIQNHAPGKMDANDAANIEQRMISAADAFVAPGAAAAPGAAPIIKPAAPR